MSARQTDLNGFIEVKGNPISKVGVFPYLGAQLGKSGADANKIFQVYRPEEELNNPETINSFKLVPFIDDHAMLGSEDAGLTPAEKKGIQGVIGEDVYFESPYLRGNLKIYSEAAKNLIDTDTKVELSPGYRCRYEFTEGVFDGKRYDAIQRDLRGNHLALVDEGRTGPDVKVLDAMRFTLDSNDLKEAFMADENKTVEAKATDFDETQMAQLRGVLAKLLEEMGIKPVATDEDPAKKAADEEGKAKEAKAADADPQAKTNESAGETASEAKESAAEAVEAITEVVARVDELEAKAEGMDAAIFKKIADRDSLVGKVSKFVGTFDSASMTATDVAAYACKKLGIPAAKGQERVAVDAWMHGRTPDTDKATHATDSKPVSGGLRYAWITNK